MRSIVRFSAIGIAGLLMAGTAAAHSGDHRFVEAFKLSGAHKTVSDADPVELYEEAVAAAAMRFAELAVEDGERLVPAGTVCDDATYRDGVLRVRFTFPSSLPEDGVSATMIENVSGLLQQTFFRDDMTEIRLHGRRGFREAFRPLGDFLPRMEPVKSATGPEFWEYEGPGPQPSPDYSEIYTYGQNGKIAGQSGLGTSGMPAGALAGRTVFVGAGHGWTAGTSSWGLQRPLLLSMNEDYGNIDQINYFANYLFNAGATVVAMRPLGVQDNEVIIHSGSASGFSTTGTWAQSADPNFWNGGSNYLFADANPTETATAVFTPNFPEAGFYPVYCWANYGSNRVSGQLYRIRHRGGETQIRINHRRVGRGWVWLGNYSFDAGSDPATGSVVISNTAPPVGTTTGVVIADAVRFGNGRGDINRGFGVSGYEKEAEASRYWVQGMVGNATSPATTYDSSSSDLNDNVSTPPRMAAEMRNDDGQGYNGDIYLGWHSNAANSVARGSVGLITNFDGTPANQAAFAALVSDQLDADAVIEDANWEHNWVDRAAATLTGGYGEITNGRLNGEMCGTIIEVAFHDTPADAELLRDPKVRNVAGRACYRAIVRYFAQFDGGLSTFLPEPPRRVRVRKTGPASATVAWAAPATGAANGGAATGYRVYRSLDGIAFDAGTSVGETSYDVVLRDSVEYFRVAATNAGGESMPGETVGVRGTAGTSSAVLVVNGYDRIDRFNNEEEFPASPVDDENERVRNLRNNEYNYVIEHGEAISEANHDFDSCSNEAVIEDDANLNDYAAVVWILGEESTDDETFGTAEQQRVSSYLNGGGRLFATGAEIAWDLGAQGGGPAFLSSALQSVYTADDAGTYTAAGTPGGIFEGISLAFGPGGRNYDAGTPDVLGAFPGGASIAMTYTGGGSGGAAVVFSGGSPTKKTVVFGFPFELIDSAATRSQVMEAVLDFFEVPRQADAPGDAWMLR